MTVGTIVKLKVCVLGNPIGTIGVGFNDYGSGCQFIFKNGEYDGFNIEEQKSMLEEIGFSNDVSGYQFQNVMQVSRDFEKGFWREEFK